MWPDESLNVNAYDFNVENIGASDDDLQEYIRSYEPAGSPVAAVSAALEPMSTESEQVVMETDDLENPDGTVQVTLFLPDGQPYVLDCRRLDHV
ncbi:uncharacterized protein Dvir_GJ17046 [Drosophila virilis]|uniref:Uncharacterized protein n=2 Tax=Drosophila virilis TaxID=7244 RepID=A0A0Q9WF12_DROVI|nr:uncharacterized protein Dvir_GJ17046 [Drosophila virilis]